MAPKICMFHNRWLMQLPYIDGRRIAVYGKVNYMLSASSNI